MTNASLQSKSDIVTAHRVGAVQLSVLLTPKISPAVRLGASGSDEQWPSVIVSRGGRVIRCWVTAAVPTLS